MRTLRDIWEETSHRLERLQANPKCAREEKKNIYDRPGPSYRLTFPPAPASPALLRKKEKPAVAVIREEGSNSDREMSSAFHQAGFDVWDVTMTDFLERKVDLDVFRGVAFVGGFSYADVLDSAKGWAGVIRFNKGIFEQFRRVLRADRHVLPRRVQRVPADGAARLDPVGRDRGQVPAPVHTEPLGPVRVPVRDRPDIPEPLGHAQGDGRLDARYLGRPRRRTGPISPTRGSSRKVESRVARPRPVRRRPGGSRRCNTPSIRTDRRERSPLCALPTEDIWRSCLIQRGHFLSGNGGLCLRI